MKKYLLLFIPFCSNAQVAAVYKERFCQSFIDKYCKELTIFVHQQKFSISDYFEGNARAHWVNSMPQAVHEAYHAYNTILNNESDSSKWFRYYHFNGTIAKVQKEKFFSASEISRIIPENIQAKIGRYSAYVNENYNGEGEQDSKINGIYGLVEEFAAYCNSFKIYVLSYQFFKDNFPVDSSKVWIDYLTENSSLVSSYYEFKLFILWYFRLAKERYFETYKKLTMNSELMKLYKSIDREFEKNISLYWENRAEIVKKLKSKVIIKGSYLLRVDTSEAILLPDDKIVYMKNLIAGESTL